MKFSFQRLKLVEHCKFSWKLFSEKLHLRCLTGFWVGLWLQRIKFLTISSWVILPWSYTLLWQYLVLLIFDRLNWWKSNYRQNCFICKQWKWFFIVVLLLFKEHFSFQLTVVRLSKNNFKVYITRCTENKFFF